MREASRWRDPDLLIFGNIHKLNMNATTVSRSDSHRLFHMYLASAGRCPRTLPAFADKRRQQQREQHTMIHLPSLLRTLMLRLPVIAGAGTFPCTRNLGVHGRRRLPSSFLVHARSTLPISHWECAVCSGSSHRNPSASTYTLLFPLSFPVNDRAEALVSRDSAG